MRSAGDSSKRLLEAISHLIDSDDERSIDIFGASSSSESHGTLSSSSSPRQKPQTCSLSTEGLNGYDIVQMDDESFHNSLNDWMGSFSDIIEKKKQLGGKTSLNPRDQQLMKKELKRFNELSDLLTHSLATKQLLAPSSKGRTRLSSATSSSSS